MTKPRVDPFPIPVHGSSGASIGDHVRTWAIRGFLVLITVACIVGGVSAFSPSQSPLAGESFTETLDAGSPSTAAEDGPFQFKFREGERRVYTMKAKVSGVGWDTGDPDGVDMQFKSDLVMKTEKVHSDGGATMEMYFDRTTFEGDFMGNPFDMLITRNLAQTTAGGRNALPKKSPQATFFQTPIRMEVSPNGEVTHLSGPGEIAALIAEAPFYSELAFPQAAMESGRKWTTELKLPVPGVAQPFNATIENHYMYDDFYGARKCGVIQQKIKSVQLDGQIADGFSGAGEELGFSMPEFKLAGQNIVYFDLENGSVVYSDMKLNLKLSIGQALGAAGEVVDSMLQNMGELVGDDLPEFEGFGQKKPGQENLLDLDADIAAAIALK